LSGREVEDVKSGENAGVLKAVVSLVNFFETRIMHLLVVK
jgi:hypothetical protein